MHAQSTGINKIATVDISIVGSVSCVCVCFMFVHYATFIRNCTRFTASPCAVFMFCSRLPSSSPRFAIAVKDLLVQRVFITSSSAHKTFCAHSLSIVSRARSKCLTDPWPKPDDRLLYETVFLFYSDYCGLYMQKALSEKAKLWKLIGDY